MSVANQSDPTSYLQQTGSGGPGPTNTTLPDVATDFQMFQYMNNLLPATVLPAYKTINVLFTDADWMASYANPAIWCGIVQHDGQQCIQLKLGDDSLFTTPTPNGVESRAVAIDYNSTSHTWTLRVYRPLTTTGWEHSGSFVSDFSGTPFTVQRILADGINATVPAMSGGYYRMWQGRILTDDELNQEYVSAVAWNTASLVTDTPLISDTDVTDVSGNGNDWNIIGTGLSTILPGPLAGDTAFIVMPDGDLTGSTDLYVCAPQSAVKRIVTAPTYPVVAMCGTRAGGWWAACDNTGTGFTRLVEYNGDGTILQTVELDVQIGNGVGGQNDLMELPLTAFAPAGLLSIVRATGDVVRIDLDGGTIGKTYGLNVSILDAAVNVTGTRLIYFDGADVKAWNLETDEDLGTIVTPDDPLRCCIWLPDCTFLGTTADYLGDGVIQRYTMAGVLMPVTYAYDPTPFDEGIYLLAASLDRDRLYVIGDWDNGSQSEQPGVLMFSLASGAQIGPVVPLVGGIDDFDVLSAVAMPVATVMCVPGPSPLPTITYPIRRERVFALPWDNENKVKFVRRLEFVMKVGIGLNTSVEHNRDPHIMVEMSYDGGETYGNIRTLSVGELGAYFARVFALNWGSGRNPVARMSCTDDVNWQFIQCLADLELGTS